MAETFDAIDESLAAWVRDQKMFFVATAPKSDEGLVNCSPKGMDTFRILSPNKVAYLDLTGSGVETIAHLKENGRIVIMMCAFEGGPRIVRFHGRGKVLEAGSPGYAETISEFTAIPGVRSIILIHVTRIGDSCGYSVPLYDYRGNREVLTKWAVNKGAGGVLDYQQNNNLKSLDGLPGLTSRPASA